MKLAIISIILTSILMMIDSTSFESDENYRKLSSESSEVEENQETESCECHQNMRERKVNKNKSPQKDMLSTACGIGYRKNAHGNCQKTFRFK
jgi:mannitol-specific phosphotransferase system IIBC component